MSIFKDIVTLWNSDNLLSQAWDESHNMMTLSNEIFLQALLFIREGGKNKKIKSLKKRDEEINTYHREVRRKVVTHYAIVQNMDDLPSGLVLLNMVVDIERVGDYTKNILDLALNYPDTICSEKISQDLYNVEQEVTDRFNQTIKAITNQDQDLAKGLMKGYKKNLTKICDAIVNDCISGKIKLNSESQTAALALYARYLKRIGGHLYNIATILVNPFEAVGYKK